LSDRAPVDGGGHRRRPPARPADGPPARQLNELADAPFPAVEARR
jgi:hypothetical protein